jgi:hypothetical protein
MRGVQSDETIGYLPIAYLRPMPYNFLPAGGQYGPGEKNMNGLSKEGGKRPRAALRQIARPLFFGMKFHFPMKKLSKMSVFASLY